MTQNPPPLRAVAAPSASPPFGVNEIRKRSQALQEVMRGSMKEGTHYGTLPGTPRPSLWKAGAEVLCLTFHLAPMLESRVTVDDPEAAWPYQGGRGDGVPASGICHGYFEVEATCTIYGSNGDSLSRCSARCNNREIHYRNLGLYDIRNTILKMAEKRAFVSATLLAAGASDLFTQDLEDMPALLEGASLVSSLEPKATPPVRTRTNVSAKREAWLLREAQEANLPSEVLERCLTYLRGAEGQVVKAFFDDLSRHRNVFEPFLQMRG